VTRAYKFLARGAVGRFSEFEWPHGAWVETSGALTQCVEGVHACRRVDLLDWIDDELWEIELDGAVEVHDSMLVAERGRLLWRLPWDDASATDFAEQCAWRARGVALKALRRSGLTEEAAGLASAAELVEMQEWAVAAVRGSDGPTRDVAALAADVVALVHGRRPETWDIGAVLAEAVPAQTPAATAANLAFVVAHAAGVEAVAETGDQAAYGAGFAAERAWQLRWLTARLELTYP
jgi:hypothetical protein